MNRTRNGVRSTLLVVPAAAMAVACNDVSWPDPQYIDSLRVLAVKGEPPALAPNQATELSLLCADGHGGPEADPTCDIETAWFAECDNPTRNDPQKCFDTYRSWGKKLSPTVSDTPPEEWPHGFSFGPRMQFQAPEDILKYELEVPGQAADQAADEASREKLRYGNSYVYFAACAGKLVAEPDVDERLPVSCVDPDSGKRLGQDRFVVGITTLYSYEGITTKNPELVDTRFVDSRLDAPLSVEACSDADECPTGFACSENHVCLPSVSPCNEKTQQSCEWHCFQFGVTDESYRLFRSDGVALRSPTKALWVEYFTNAGVFPDDDGFALPPPAANDSSRRNPCIFWRAPPNATDNAHLWVVVRDDRGGVATWDQRVIVR
ncbi:MAG: hypothetical protein QM784_09065 [Polyangiaceae bacterium]